MKVTVVPQWRMDQIMDFLVPQAASTIEREVYHKEQGTDYYKDSTGYLLDISVYEETLKQEGMAVWLQNGKHILVFKASYVEHYNFIKETVRGALKGCDECQVE